MSEEPIPYEKHQHILKALEIINPHDEDEVLEIEAVTNWINSGAPIYRDENPNQHIVCYASLIDESNRLFLVEHKKAGLWLCPGGHPELGENLYDSVCREVEEELGINNLTPVFGTSPFFLSSVTTVGVNAGHRDIDFWFAFKCDSEYLASTMPPEDFYREFSNSGWYSLDEILKFPPETTDKHMHRFCQKLIGAI